MGMGYESVTRHSVNTTTSESDSLIAGPINIEHFDKFCLEYKNSATVAMVEVRVELAVNLFNTATHSAPVWVAANSTTIPNPSALGASATVQTSAIENVYRWLRVIGRSVNATTAGDFTLTVAGHKRF